MDASNHFDQLESPLADLARKVDQQGEQTAQTLEVLNRQGEAISRQGEAINRLTEIVEQRFGTVGEQMGGIINILKLPRLPAAEG